jgi:hypothetical protein
MKTTTRLAAALLAAFTLAAQIPASAETTNYTILDSYTDGVPTGTSYQELEYYSQYVDAFSVDHSPFVLTKTTANSGGILFYGSTELISAANANTSVAANAAAANSEEGAGIEFEVLAQSAGVLGRNVAVASKEHRTEQTRGTENSRKVRAGEFVFGA